MELGRKKRRCTNAIKCEKEKRIFKWRHVVTTTSAICGVHPEHARPKPVGNLSRHTDLLCEFETSTCSNHH
jgi:hypothetical protein